MWADERRVVCEQIPPQTNGEHDWLLFFEVLILSFIVFMAAYEFVHDFLQPVNPVCHSQMHSTAFIADSQVTGRITT
jgi:hypothetical protein